MATITHGKYMFGEFAKPEDRPDLPEGWEWKTSAKDFALVISPDGHEYFAGGDGTATPKRVFPHEGTEYDDVCTLKDGQSYAEQREEIQLFTP